MMICHGKGWIMQGENAAYHAGGYIEALISHAQRGETVHS